MKDESPPDNTDSDESESDCRDSVWLYFEVSTSESEVQATIDALGRLDAVASVDRVNPGMQLEMMQDLYPSNPAFFEGLQEGDFVQLVEVQLDDSTAGDRLLLSVNSDSWDAAGDLPGVSSYLVSPCGSETVPEAQPVIGGSDAWCRNVVIRFPPGVPGSVVERVEAELARIRVVDRFQVVEPGERINELIDAGAGEEGEWDRSSFGPVIRVLLKSSYSDNGFEFDIGGAATPTEASAFQEISELDGVRTVRGAGGFASCG